MSELVIVGIDGSAHAWRALDWALEHARLHRRLIRLVHASRGLVADGSLPEATLRRLVAERRDLLEEAQWYASKRSSDLDVTTVLVTCEPGQALLDEAERAALVVVGARGGGRIEELLLGSVSLHVAAHSRCPVLVVPRAAPYPPDAVPEIVVGVEGRGPEDRLLAWAFEEVSARAARLVAVHATGVEFGSPRRRIVEDIELSEALVGWTTRYPDVDVIPTIDARSPAQALLAASEKAGLVVVGARRRHGPPILAVGRVTHTVLHRSRCPVAVVPAE
ncbi:universal stress protein [Spirillospora sp. NPDC048911]|uniref:universal stress protein n=1 Tax=Spirillospora sp. NPDC048911 TaxID=3364527 RepID=UPI003710531D